MDRNTRRSRRPVRGRQNMLPVLFIIVLVVVMTMVLTSIVHEQPQEEQSDISTEQSGTEQSLQEEQSMSAEESISQEEPQSDQQYQSEAQSSAQEQTTPPTGTNIPAGFEHLFVAGEDYKLVLVSKDYVMPAEFPDLELVTVGSYQVHSMIYEPLTRMMADAADAGLPLTLISGQRPFSRSQILYDNKVQELINSGYSPEQAATEAARWVAPPGTSEHATGLAVDLVSVDYFTVLPDLLPEFEEFDEAKWLAANCADYGFILRYPKGDEDITQVVFEPWHFRYVGVEVAKEITQAGITLEEYLGVV